MSDCKPYGAPLDTNEKLSKENTSEPVSTNTPYMEAVGSLIYAMVATRPDICFATGLVSRYMSNPLRTHWLAVKHIFRYLKGTEDYGLVYDGNTKHPIEGYSDSDWASDIDDRKSTSSNCYLLSNAAISWYSKKQATVARSTVEAEYVSLGVACTEGKWIKMFLQEAGLEHLYLNSVSQNSGSSTRKRKDDANSSHNHKRPKHDLTIQVYGDNTGSIALTKDPKNHARTKHIDIQYHFVRGLVEQRDIQLSYKSTGEMVADVLTKSLTPKLHQKFTKMLGLQKISQS